MQKASEAESEWLRWPYPTTRKPWYSSNRVPLCQATRRDVIISQLTQANAALAARVPELEAAESHEEAAEAAETVEHEPEREKPHSATVEAQEGTQRPWWQRWFGS
jgi:hypothetical protein